MKRIESVSNPKVKEWKKLHTKKGRDQAKMFLVEGKHLVEEALKYHIEIEEILVSERLDVPREWDVSNVSITYVTEKVLKELSETETPQGIIAICKQSEADKTHKFDTLLLVDRVQDPGNLGAIIRTADATGISAVIIGEGSADLYNGKTVRATQGSIFHLPIWKGDLMEWINICKQENITVYGTSLQGAKSYTSVESDKRFALIVGNEGAGVSKELLEHTKQNLFIPIYGKAESLNVVVATGILLYHLKANL